MRIALGALVLSGCHMGPDRVSNERHASRLLKSLAPAEADFRANDRDQNGIQDFWTGDVAGLYEAGRLIERELAEADAAPLKPLVPKPVPFHGYFFRALLTDRSVNPPEEYGQSTDRSGRKVHHPSKYGFVAYPAEHGKTGNVVLLFDHGQTMIQRQGPEVLLHWPSDEELRKSYPRSPPTPVRQVKDAVRELPQTVVTAHLNEKHVPGKNLLWCATMQLAWNEFKELEGPVKLDGDPEMARGLDLRLHGPEVIDPSKHVTMAGSVEKGIIEAIRKAMASKFPDAKASDFPEGAAVDRIAFSFLRSTLPLEFPLWRHDGLWFSGRKVVAFGLWDGHGKVPDHPQMAQVKVRDYVSASDFIVELVPKRGETKLADRILIARVKPETTLLETVQRVMNRAEKPSSSFREQDHLIVPCVNFDLTRDYVELCRSFSGHPGIKMARQSIQFRLDEEGAILKSKAELGWVLLNGDPAAGRSMVCDRPFLILLAMEGAKLPYFAFWVANDELLIR